MSRALAFALVAGCGRLGFDAVEDAGVPPADANPALYWGDFAATLPVGPCTGAELLVSDASDALDADTTVADPAAAGPTLSLVEALWIATNRAGRDAIRFDPAVFPASTPATIVIGPTAAVPFSLTDVCIDARSRGVIVDWAACEATGCPPRLAESLIIGLTMIHINSELVVANAQVAGCRLGTDGTATLTGGRPWTVELTGGTGATTTLGPGNVLAGAANAVRIFGGEGDMRVTGNGIGYDLLTHAVVTTPTGIDPRTSFNGTVPTLIEDNVFGATDTAITSFTSGLTHPIELRGNYIGVDREGRALPGATALSANGGVFTVGPGNTLEHLATAIAVNGGQVTITANRITGNAAGIAYSIAPPVPPPAITAVTPTQIAGTCTSGTVEVFADPGDQGAELLGRAPCTAQAFTLAGTFPSGRNATATETVAGGTSAFSAPVPIP